MAKTINLLYDWLLANYSEDASHNESDTTFFNPISNRYNVLVRSGEIGWLFPYFGWRKAWPSISLFVHKASGFLAKTNVIIWFLKGGVERVNIKVKLKVRNIFFQTINVWKGAKCLVEGNFDVHVRRSPGCGNAGDVVLSELVSNQVSEITNNSLVSVNTAAPLNWFTEKLLRQCKRLWIGGGGWIDVQSSDGTALLWSPFSEKRDYSNKSFWMSIGYNLFYNETLSSDQRLKLKSVFSSAPYIGIRDSGSLEVIEEITKSGENLVFRPCPTTFRLSSPHPSPKLKSLPIMLINIAGDRISLRYKNLANVFQEIETLASSFWRRGILLKMVFHTEEDLIIKRLFDKHNLPEINLVSKPTKIVKEVYSSAACVIATRTHSQMIAFGCNTPVITLVTHPKTRFFAIDAGIDDMSISEKEFSYDNLNDRVLNILDDPPDYAKTIDKFRFRTFLADNRLKAIINV